MSINSKKMIYIDLRTSNDITNYIQKWPKPPHPHPFRWGQWDGIVQYLTNISTPKQPVWYYHNSIFFGRVHMMYPDSPNRHRILLICGPMPKNILTCTSKSTYINFTYINLWTPPLPLFVQIISGQQQWGVVDKSGNVKCCGRQWTTNIGTCAEQSPW